MNDLKCPNQDSLSAYFQGHLTSQKAQRVLSHVNKCKSCKSILEKLAETEDLLQGLRNNQKIVELCKDPVYQQALAKAESFTLKSAVHEDTAKGETPKTGTLVEKGPKKLRDYHLNKKIGMGGMGTVYQAIHSRLQKVVALKVLPSNSLNTQ